MINRNQLVNGLLAAVGVAIIAWQFVEHNRVERSARVALINRAKDISTTLGLVMRSQRHFGVISQDRLESALTALVKPEELNAVALLNAAGEVVASAGAAIDFEMKDLVPTGEHWGTRMVTLMNLVDLGTNLTTTTEGSRPTIVLARNEMPRPFGTNRPPPGPPPPGPPPPFLPDTARTNADNDSQFTATTTNSALEASNSTNSATPSSRPWNGSRASGGDRRPPFGRPFWMREDEYKSAIQKKGVHSVVMMLSTQSVRAIARQDLWLRWIISVLASVSVVGLAMAWQNLMRSSELELRLVRAAELNTHLKEMNLAAAGLAHETRNPLNIVRGLAQMISQQHEASSEVQKKSREIINETDRITAQLNEFMNYSRPREVRRAPVDLNAAVSEVVRALGSDIEEKAIHFQVALALPAIEADEQLLRQALFNLLINAIQAVERGGEVQVIAEKVSASEAKLEIRDNGPGVPPEHRSQIFKPYFTTHQKGTGLGLAVVQQIVLAHGWEVSCLPNEPQGAILRIAHLKLAGKSSDNAA